MTRFFLAGPRRVGETVALDAGDARKATLVLRLRDGDAVEAIDGAGTSYLATLARAPDGGAAVRLIALAPVAQAPEREIVLAQGIPKGAKMDYVIEKATELGVARIVPLRSDRSVATADGEAKLRRWRRLARTAAQQCGRTTIPAVDEPCSLAELFAESRTPGERLLFPWEVAEPRPLRDRLPAILAGCTRLVLAIGPEGGFSHAEAAQAEAAGAEIVSLGRRILRTETAALVVVAVIRYAAGEL